MTQLPEVEVIRKDLEREVVGKRFKDVTVRHAALVGRHRNRPEFVKALQGRKIQAINRRGTWLLFELDEDDVFVIRLGAQATLTRETATEEPGRHTQFVGTFTTGGALHYSDPLKDGEMFVTEAEGVGQLADLSPGGIDPLADTFTWTAFSQQLKAHAGHLRSVLVDETFMVGLGDVYADEVLWAAGLSGGRAPASLSSQEVRRLYRAVLEVLYEAVKQGGAGAEPPEAAGEDDEEETAGFLKVYGREDQPCARCRRPIRRGEIDGAQAFFCGQCQT